MIRRLLLTYLTLTLLILVGLAVPLGYVYQRGEQQRAFAQLEHDTEVLAAFIDTALSQGEPAQIDVLAHESAQRWSGHVDVVDASGRLRSSTRTLPLDPAAAADLHTVLAGQGVASGIAEVAGVPLMSVAVPIHPGEPAQGALRVSVPTTAMTARIHQFWTVLAGVAVVVLVTGALVAVALARWIGRPVRTLERATRRLAEGGTPPAAPTTTGPPELRSLAATFNATAIKLRELITGQQAFAGHASHQLKTPLAALRLRLENLESDVTASGEANLRAALVETDRLTALVDTLLAMTRSENTVQPCEPVTVASVVADRLDAWRAVAEDRSVTLTASGADELTVRAIPGAVEQILDNLIANALDVAPAGSRVAVTWKPQAAPHDAMVELHVIDAGPGLSPEQRSQALQPFWRAPDAVRGGTGLGLALVRKLAEASGGRSRLDAAEPSGVDAIVVLPAAEAQVAAEARAYSARP